LICRLFLHDLEHEGIELLVERGPSFLINGPSWSTGQIERTTAFEKGLPIQETEVDGSWQPDPWVYDDQAHGHPHTNKGLVVITGCGHAGVINIVQQARSQTGWSRSMPCWEDSTSPEPCSSQLFPRRLKRYSRSSSGDCSAHCTGWRATQRIAQALPEAYTPNSVGTTFKLLAE